MLCVIKTEPLIAVTLLDKPLAAAGLGADGFYL